MVPSSPIITLRNTTNKCQYIIIEFTVTLTNNFFFKWYGSNSSQSIASSCSSNRIEYRLLYRRSVQLTFETTENTYHKNTDINQSIPSILFDNPSCQETTQSYHREQLSYLSAPTSRAEWLLATTDRWRHASKSSSPQSVRSTRLACGHVCTTPRVTTTQHPFQ